MYIYRYTYMYLFSILSLCKHILRILRIYKYEILYYIYSKLLDDRKYLL